MGERTFEIGEMIPSMVAEMQRGLEACIAKNRHRRECYYILYHASWYKNGEELRSVFSARSHCPPKMLGTICWRIDNTLGLCEELWVIPKDAPTQPVKLEREVNENIAQAAKGLSIIYSPLEIN